MVSCLNLDAMIACHTIVWCALNVALNVYNKWLFEVGWLDSPIQASVLARVTTLLENDNSTCGQCERGCP